MNHKDLLDEAERVCRRRRAIRKVIANQMELGTGDSPFRTTFTIKEGDALVLLDGATVLKDGEEMIASSTG